MNKKERLELLKDTHKRYVDWWMPIDIACNSCLAPMSFKRFCDSLLTYPDEWWSRWLGDKVLDTKKTAFKQYILDNHNEWYTI